METPHRVVSVFMAALIAISPSLRVAHAEPLSGTLSTVRTAFDSALALSPEAQSQKRRVEALMARRTAADSLTAQPLVLEGAYRSDRKYSNQGLREIELGLSAPLWNWNERDRTQLLRDHETNTALARLEAIKLVLAGEVRQLVWETMSAQLDVEIAQTRVLAAHKLVADVARRVDAGELAKTDFYQVQSLHAQAQSEAGRARALLSDIAVEFSSTTGLPVSALQGIEAEKAVNFSGTSLLDHPSVKLAYAQGQTFDRQVELTKTQKRANPELGLGVISERSVFGAAAEKSLVLSTRIPLGNSPEYQSRVLEAQSNQLEAHATLKKTERSIIAKQRAAQSNVDVFEQMRKTAQEQAELARRVFALHQQSFELGETDLPTLLRHEQLAFEAERLARKSEIEHASRVSAYRQALGHLPE